MPPQAPSLANHPTTTTANHLHNFVNVPVKQTSLYELDVNNLTSPSYLKVRFTYKITTDGIIEQIQFTSLISWRNCAHASIRNNPYIYSNHINLFTIIASLTEDLIKMLKETDFNINKLYFFILSDNSYIACCILKYNEAKTIAELQ